MDYGTWTQAFDYEDSLVSYDSCKKRGHLSIHFLEKEKKSIQKKVWRKRMREEDGSLQAQTSLQEEEHVENAIAQNVGDMEVLEKGKE